MAVTAEERHDFAVKLERKDDAEFEFAADLIEETLKNFNELRVIARKPSRPERRQKGATNSLSVSQMTEESQIILKLAPRYSHFESLFELPSNSQESVSAKRRSCWRS